MTYHNEFPTYPASDMPALPEGWTDESWHNDACPKYVPPLRARCNGRLEVFIDWNDAAEREIDCGERFIVALVDDNGAEDIFRSDDWTTVLAFVARVSHPNAPLRYVVQDVASEGADFFLWGDDAAAAQAEFQRCRAEGLDVELIAMPRDLMDTRTAHRIGNQS